MQAAIYARKSTEQSVADDQKSVARQVDHARAYADRQGWRVADEHIFIDDGISGAEFTNRPGFVRLMNALKPRAPFQTLVMSEVSRLGREQIETAYALKQLSVAGVRCFSYLENRELLLESATDKFLLGAVTFAADLEREKARQRTYDAMIRKARAGHVAGGNCFGYRNVAILAAGGQRSHVERIIEPAEAAVVVEIFEAYVNGTGLRPLAKRLNEARRPSPRAQQGRPNGWTPSSLWAVLRRPIYRGELVWNQTRKRNQWGAKAPAERDEREWVRVPAPALRIVPEALAQAAVERAAGTRAAYLRSTRSAAGGRPVNGAESRYLLTGLMRCAHCGASMIVRSRSHGHQRAFRYACCGFHLKGRAVCANSLDVRMEQADDAILSDIEQFVLHPELVGRAIDLALDDLQPRSDRADRERARLEQDRRAVTAEIANLTRALAVGGDLNSLIQALKQAEARQTTIQATIRALDDRAAFTPRAATDLRTEVLAKMAAWRATLRQEAPEARAVLRCLLTDRISLEAVPHGDGRVYRYRGTFTVGGLFEGTLCPKLLASPRGSQQSWTIGRTGLIAA